MSYICEHIFKKKDPRRPKYSMAEFDLKATLGLSIRKNFESELFEIFTIWTDVVMFKGSLDKVVDEANRLEDEKHPYIEIKCRDSCKNHRHKPNAPVECKARPNW